MTAKKIVGVIHLWLGLSSGLVVMIVALTGSIMVFEKEIDESVNSDFYFVKAGEQLQRLAVDSLLERVKDYDSSLKISNIHLSTATAERTAIFTGKKGKYTYNVAVNPYTGQVLRAINFDKRFFSIVLQMHRFLLMGKTGKAITGASCLVFFIMICTGLVLWWPKKMKQFKQRAKIKWSGTGIRLNWDLHAVSGFYAHLVLLTISLTGLIFAYRWVNDIVFKIVDGRPQKRIQAPANNVAALTGAGYYEGLFTRSNQHLPYKGEMNITIPAKDSLAITVTKENPEASIPNVIDFLYFERGTGRLLMERLYKNESTGMKLRRAVLPVHTGRIYGWPTKIIVLICVLVALSLPFTGLRIWLGKRRKIT